MREYKENTLICSFFSVCFQCGALYFIGQLKLHWKSSYFISGAKRRFLPRNRKTKSIEVTRFQYKDKSCRNDIQLDRLAIATSACTTYALSPRLAENTNMAVDVQFTAIYLNPMGSIATAIVISNLILTIHIAV